MTDTLFDLPAVQPTTCARCDDRPAEVTVTGHANLLGGMTADGFAPFAPVPVGRIPWTRHTAPTACCYRCARYLAWAWNAPYEVARPHQERIVVMAVPLESAAVA
ncbi:hypothetical protein [Streptomyces scopuliridis]|uniref:Uncharacterized protein n=1 Tax=Streptomyces scopuliridis RB72 TaxID=1440053 RepID=A0A2T7SNZ8_9ACTN|nr:hypothetical protein [Streptomyces scopuliridis]PVE04628.1 hypothetical protein Y717_10560 [Streptomyces scopuliridis RB72]